MISGSDEPTLTDAEERDNAAALSGPSAIEVFIKEPHRSEPVVRATTPLEPSQEEVREPDVRQHGQRRAEGQAMDTDMPSEGAAEAVTGVGEDPSEGLDESATMSGVEGEVLDRALGCVLGACVGDAAGATLEFLGRQPGHEEVAWAMTMPGGGVWRVAPGQITDDAELAMCLSLALTARGPYDVEQVARSYVRWYESHPFDIGNTTINALSAPGRGHHAEGPSGGVADVMRRASQSRNMGSKANGSLMRCAPLAVWGRARSDEEVAEAAMLDSRLTHPNPSCQHAVACYVLAAAALIEGATPQAAFERAWRHAHKHAAAPDASSDEGAAEVLRWLQDAHHNVVTPYHPQAGFVRIAFTHAFRHLLLGTAYPDAIAETLLGGGDTDTNACIVGGLVGAAQGAQSIPAPMRRAVLSCDTTLGRVRPDFLHPRGAPAWCQAHVTSPPPTGEGR